LTMVKEFFGLTFQHVASSSYMMPIEEWNWRGDWRGGIEDGIEVSDVGFFHIHFLLDDGHVGGRSPFQFHSYYTWPHSPYLCNTYLHKISH
jgi:hypothetical protein